jgi:DNA adenine methylase
MKQAATSTLRMPATPPTAIWPVSAQSTAAPRPFLKWAGGKGQLLGEFRKLYPRAYGRYFEPFLGGGAVYFGLRPRSAWLNDINAALIMSYKNLKGRPEAVIAELRLLEDEYFGGTDAGRSVMFYRVRNQYNVLPTHTPQKTASLIFLNKTCYNGMYRESAAGHFNVPFGRYRTPKILDEENLASVSALLGGATLSSLPFEEAVRDAGENDFVYFDPPYHPLSPTSSFTSYHAQDFSAADQVRLRDLFVELDKRGCFLMLSNSFSDFTKNLYRGFHQHTVLANRAINCKATGRGRIKELVVTNYELGKEDRNTGSAGD